MSTSTNQQPSRESTTQHISTSLSARYNVISVDNSEKEKGDEMPNSSHAAAAEKPIADTLEKANDQMLNIDSILEEKCAETFAKLPKYTELVLRMSSNLGVLAANARKLKELSLEVAKECDVPGVVSANNKNGVDAQRNQNDMRMPSGDRSSSQDAQENPFLFRHMPGRDDKRSSGGEFGNPNGRPNSRMPNRNMGGGNFESRGYSSESAGGRPQPGGMNDNLNSGPDVFPENEYDQQEEQNGRDTNGMNSWAKTKKPGVKADTSFREKMQQFQNSPFMKGQSSKGKSRHAEDSYPNDMSGGGGGGGESNLRRKRAEKPKKKKSKVPAKPGHANPRYGNKFHYSRGNDADADGEGPAGSARGQHCFKKASSTCSVRVMQENFASYTRCIFENRKRFGTECEEWAGAQGACMQDMLTKCPKQNPAATTKCLREKNTKGEVSNACRDSSFFKSLEQGFGKFEKNYDAAGGDNTFEHEPGQFSGGQDPKEFMKQAYNDAKGDFTSPNMEDIKKAAQEAFMKEQQQKQGGTGAGAGAGFGGFPGGGAGQHQQGTGPAASQSIPRERQLEGNGKLSQVDDL